MTWREQDQNHLCFFHVWVCVYWNLTVCNPGVTVKERISEAAASQRLRHPSEPPWQHLLVILPFSHCLLDPPLPPAPLYTRHSYGSWLLISSVFFIIKGAQCLHVPETKQSYKSHPQCQGWLLESSLLTALISVCPAANTCLLTLISRNFMSPDDECECANKMLQVL